jgi:3-dehydroquinate dehydratase
MGLLRTSLEVEIFGHRCAQRHATDQTLAERDPSYYGTESLDDIEKYATAAGQKLGLRVVCAQDNYEGAMVEHIHAARTYGAVIMNPNSFVHCKRLTFHLGSAAE